MILGSSLVGRCGLGSDVGLISVLLHKRSEAWEFTKRSGPIGNLEIVGGESCFETQHEFDFVERFIVPSAHRINFGRDHGQTGSSVVAFVDRQHLLSLSSQFDRFVAFAEYGEKPTVSGDHVRIFKFLVVSLLYAFA